MEHKRISIFVSAFLLCLLSACQMTGVTPAPQLPGAGIIANNPGGPIQLAPTSTTPTAMPTASSGCNQLGCPYPAVCDKISGVCTINQQQGPGAAAPQAPGAGIIANNPGANSLVPACSPPVPSVSNINSFCANQVAKLGGATWDQNPPVADPSVALHLALINNFSDNSDCFNNQTGETCSGPQDAKVTYQFCTSCGAPNYVALYSDYDATYGPNVCSKGYFKDSEGYCDPADLNKPYAGICPSGSHYDNTLQNCADDATNQLASPCPSGYPYFLPDDRLCLAKAYAIVFDCQDFTIPLGECAAQVKKVCQKPAGGCGLNMNGSPKTWNQATCSCQ